MKRNPLGALLLVGLLALLATDGWSGVQVYRRSQERAVVQTQYGEANGIQYGLLSVDIWSAHLRRILSYRIHHFSLTPKQEQTVRAELEKEVNALLDRVREMHPTSLKGKVGKAVVGVLIPKDKIPELVDTAMAQAGKPDTRRQLESVAVEKLDEYAAKTRDRENDLANLKPLYAHYHVDGRRALNRTLETRAAALQRIVYRYSAVMVASLFLTAGLWLLIRRRSSLAWLEKPVFALSVALALVVLLTGLSSPMLEIDARIQRIDFLLLGSRIRFDDQVLFYQSKSILQVVGTLFATHQADSLFVGALILMFSIVLPIAKLVCTQWLLLGNPPAGSRRRRVLELVAYKTGKWSMADVLVVAIFMAYVGFKSILDSQLGALDLHTTSISSVTTNRTALQPAFILFASFVLFGLLLAELIKRAATRAQPSSDAPATVPRPTPQPTPMRPQPA